jgi:hypothetical protein
MKECNEDAPLRSIIKIVNCIFSAVVTTDSIPFVLQGRTKKSGYTSED